jgi:hypothetical protein
MWRRRVTRAESGEHKASQVGLPMRSMFVIAVIGLLIAFRSEWLSSQLYPTLGVLAKILGKDAAAAGGNINSLGFALFTGCTVGIYMDFASRFSVFNLVKKEIREALHQIESPIIKMGLSGLVAFKPKRADPDFISILDSAETEFFCIGTTLPDILSFSFVERLKELSRRSGLGPNIRLLILSRQSAACALKTAIIPYHDRAHRLREQHEAALRLAHDLHDYFRASGYSGEFDVRYYVTLPTISAVFSDRLVNICFYDEVALGNRLPTWVFEKVSGAASEFSFYEHYRKHFELVWERADTVSIFSADFESRMEAISQSERSLLGHAMAAGWARNTSRA